MDLQNDLPKLKETIEQRLAKNALLWLMEYDGGFCGFIWTIRGGHVDPYYFPLTRNDVLIFDVETFKDYRGRGIISEAICKIGNRLSASGANRVFIDTAIWNHAMQKGLEKTPFLLIGVCRKIILGTRTLSVWSGMMTRQTLIRMECGPID
jgi:RimJ/RimL family protein N-acetyltransferase